jgi:hypothetical protein
MALTRKFLSALGIEDDKVDEIIGAHTETVNALKEQRDSYKADAEKLPTVQKELDDMKAAAEKNGKDAYKVKYDALKEDFDKFKADLKEKEKHARKEDAYRALLEEVGISEKRIKSVLKVSDVDSVEFDDDGKVKDADALKKSISEEWADFIVQKETTGARTATPPAGSGKVYKSKDEIMAIKDTQERQKAIAENHEMFGF